MTAVTVGATAAGATALPPGTLCGQASFTGTLPCIRITPTAPLAINHTTTITVTGHGWTHNDVVVISMCNSDATLDYPIADFGASLPIQACGKFFGPMFANPVVGATTNFTAHFLFTPGQTGSGAASDCPGNVTQVDEGVNCVVGAADLATSQTASAAVFFAPNAAATTSQTYVGGSGVNASYNVSLTSSGAGTTSGYPPNSALAGDGTSPQTIPNVGTFATSGIVDDLAPGAPAAPAGDAYINDVLINLTTGLPATCQAASAPGATPWPGELLCSYGYAVGEPVFIALKGYVAPVSAPPLASPATPLPSAPGNSIPVSTGTTVGVNLFPIDLCAPHPTPSCPTGVTVSAGAGYGNPNPGGFTADTSNVSALTALTPGKYTWEGIGTSSAAKVVGSNVLAIANF